MNEMLRSCRSCGRDVSVAAPACPACGDPQPREQASGDGERHELLTILFALIAAGVAISILAAVWK